jgi:hypothetical protein
MSSSRNVASPEKGNQNGSKAANGRKNVGKGAATSNGANKKGVLKYFCLRLLVGLVMFLGGKLMSRLTKKGLRNMLNDSRPVAWTNEKISFSWFKKLIINVVYLPFNLNKVLDESKATGALFDMKRMNRIQYRNFLYMLMAVPTPENVITGIIGKIAVANRAIRAKEIIDACAVSTWVTIAPADILIYRGHLAAFETAIDAPKKAAWKIVMKDLKILLSTFQLAANNDQPNAISILESGSFKIKGIGKKQRQVFGLKNGIDPGTIDLTGNTTKGRCLHDWWISLDNGLTWTRMAPTLDSTTQETGLKVGANVGFRHQLITPKPENNGPLQTLFITIT